jgi:hypothetical protein
MKLPKSWNDITISQFIECNQVVKEEFESVFDHEVEILSILTDEDIDYFLELSFDELSDIIKQVDFLKKQPRQKLTNKIGSFQYKGVNNLTLGEFIDLENYFAESYIDNLTRICAILWRKTNQNEWGNDKFEPYEFNLEDRKHEFDTIPVGFVYEIIPIYLKFREDFTNTYVNLFNPVISEPDDVEELDPEDLKEDKEEEVFKRWSWETTLYNLANEDITKIDAILNMPLVFVFNMLAMKKDLNI